MKEYEEIDVNDAVSEIYVFESDDPTRRHKAFQIYKTKRKITFFPGQDFALDNILLEGFTEIPDEFSKGGYIKGGLTYYLSKKIREARVTELVISKTQQNRIRKVKSGNKMVLNYHEFRSLKQQCTSINNEAKSDRSQCVNEFFYRHFSTHYEVPKEPLNKNA